MDETDRRSLLEGVGALAASLAFASVPVDASSDDSRTEDETVVGTTPTRSLAATSSRIQSVSTIPEDAEVVHRNPTLGYLVLRLPRTRTLSRQAVITDLETRSFVEYVEPNLEYELAEPVSKTEATSEPRFEDQYAPQTVRAPEAWATISGESDVTVAVLDCGADYEHEDLAEQFPADPGKDFFDDDDDPAPDRIDEDHASHVSGIVAASRDNETGISGVSDATLLNGRVLDENGRAHPTAAVQDYADAIQWATDQGADVINMSLISPRDAPHATIHGAIRYAMDNGTLVVVAAGNFGDPQITYPARYDETLAVSASDAGDNFVDAWPGVSYGSNYGPNVDVCAPG